jgi:hypothetical protein
MTEPDETAEPDEDERQPAEQSPDEIDAEPDEDERADPGEEYPGDAEATDTNTEGGHP